MQFPITEHAPLKYSINIPNFGDFSDPRTVAMVAKRTEEAGWDGLHVWDHMLFERERKHVFGDPWMLLTAAAMATHSIKLGIMVTPMARRRPQQVARQVSTLDQVSGGRAIFGAGLGAPLEDEFGAFGEPTDPRVLAEMLDEGLELVDRYWSGECVSFEGKHYRVNEVTMRPTPIQRPRVPIWIAGTWPNRNPMKRAASWDGAIPMFANAYHGPPPPLEDVKAVSAFVREHQDPNRTVDMVIGGFSPLDPQQAADVVGPYAEAGATWWDERMRIDDDRLHRVGPILRRIDQGPPLV